MSNFYNDQKENSTAPSPSAPLSSDIDLSSPRKPTKKLNFDDDSKTNMQEDIYPKVPAYVSPTGAATPSRTEISRGNLDIKLVTRSRSGQSSGTSSSSRRLTLASPSDFDGLVSASQRCYNLDDDKHPTFSYIDEDGDDIEISSSQELQSAFSCFASLPSTDKNRYKVYVDVDILHRYRPVRSNDTVSSTRAMGRSDTSTGTTTGTANVPLLGSADALIGLLQRALRNETLLPQLINLAERKVREGSTATDTLNSLTTEILKLEPNHDPQLESMARTFNTSIGSKADGLLEKHREGISSTLKSAKKLANDPTLFPKFQKVLSRCVGDILVPSFVSYADGLSAGHVNPLTHFAGPFQQIMSLMVSEPDVLALVLEMGKHFSFVGDVVKGLLSKYTGLMGSESGLGAGAIAAQVQKLFQTVRGVTTGVVTDSETGQVRPSQAGQAISGALSTILPLFTNYVNRVQGASTGTANVGNTANVNGGGSGNFLAGASGLASLASNLGLFSGSDTTSGSGTINAQSDEPSDRGTNGFSSLASGLSTLSSLASGFNSLQGSSTSTNTNNTSTNTGGNTLQNQISNATSNVLGSLKDSFLEGLQKSDQNNNNNNR